MIKKILDNNNNNNNLKTLLSSIEKKKKISVLNLGEGEIIGILNEIDRSKVFVVSNEIEAKNFYDKFVNLKYNVCMCTKTFNLLLDEMSSDGFEYLNFLNNIKNPAIDIFIITPNVLMLPVFKSFSNNDNSLAICVDMEISPQELEKTLFNIGYIKVNNIDSEGQFVLRGETLDISLFGGNSYRISFEYDVVEKIKELNENLIESGVSLPSLVVSKTNIITINEEKLKQALKGKKEESLLYENYIQFNNLYNNMWFYPFVETELIPLLDLFSDEVVVTYFDTKMIYDVAIDIIKSTEERILEGKKSKRLLSIHNNLMCIDNLSKTSKEKTCIGFHYINSNNRIFSPNQVYCFKSSPNITYGENYNSLIIDLKNNFKNGYTTLLFLNTDEYEKVIKKLTGIVNYHICKNFINIQKGILNILNKEYNNSYNFYDEKICVIGSDKVGKTYRANIDANSRLTNTNFTDFDLPKEGEYVVHKIHGIGKCLGIKNLELSKDVKREYVVIEYKNDSKLYLPIENVDSISKYIGEEEKPTLNKLGSVEFKNLKEKVRKSIKDIAKDLIEIYKNRHESKGYVYPKDDEIQKSFEEAFPYQLTFDQENVLNEIKHEMCLGKLIDRLVCGDVGFGKTEVALRVAFKTLLAGKTVLCMCPTTILSEQHYSLFKSRMQEYGISIACLNRLKSDKETNSIIKQINNGEINVIVGTHKLLNSKIHYKNLGLLIIDEEQKFGVEDKEKIKKLKKDVNIITLSATPIPRTLHLSLSGIRDISTIQTPPANKVATQIYVMEENSLTIKNAIEKELNRGGQVLVIYNKVVGIENIVTYIKKLGFENYNIDYTHGQMPPAILEKKIYKLYKGETDILVSTTLIENGVDLPNANTLLILDSDKLGLSQLYQLKGRVGRGNRDSYAYFIYSKNLTELAYKRLKAISEFSAMGSGFKIAMRDMEIRGAGNVFGSQQHGHMQKIGYALYINILNNAIDELKTNKINNKLYKEIKIDTDIKITIPQTSRFTTNQKMLIYSKIANINKIEEFYDLIKELEDVYDQVPLSLINLGKISLIKNKLYMYNADKLILKDGLCCIVFDKETKVEDISTLINEKVKLDISNNTLKLILNMNKENCLEYLISQL